MFEGGASLEAFQAVCNPEGAPAEALLAMMMDKTSLVVVEAGDDAQPRLAMLDTVREFAAEQVERPAPALEHRHARYFLAYAERAAEQAARADRRAWLAPAGARARQPPGRVRAPAARRRGRGRAADRDRVRARAAVGRARARGPRLARSRRSTRLAPEPSPRRAAALYWDGQLALSQARFAEAEPPLEQALEAARALDDRRLRPPR